MNTTGTAQAGEGSREQPVPLTEIGRLLELGMEAHRAGRLADAAAAYCALLDADADNADGLHLYGMLLAQTGQPERGHELLQRAVAANPEEPMFHNNLGNVLQGLGRLDEAEAAYRRAIELDVERYDAQNNLAVLLRRKGEFEAAERVYVELLKAAPGFTDARQNLAQMYLGLNRVDDAVRQCAIGLVTAPRNPAMRDILGTAYTAMGWHKEAVALYAKWLEEEPDNPVALHHHAAHTGQNVPEQASAGYVRHTFDGFADTFESKLALLGYRAPELVADAVRAALGTPRSDLRVADAGCGTGLCAPHLLPYARHLVGVDLSGGMLQRAAARKVYHELVQADLTAFLQARPVGFELLVSADTLCYLGRLEAFAVAARASLTAGGLLVCTVEAIDGAGAQAEETADVAADWQLRGHGRYAHRSSYVKRVLTDAGFAAASTEAVVLRSEDRWPVHGWLVQARVPPR